MCIRIRDSVALIFLLSIAACSSSGPADISGTWETETAVPYIIESTLQAPQGRPIPHEGVQFLERSAILKWTLVQRPDGSITGTNNWVSHDESGQAVLRGSEPLLGTYDGRQIILVETGDKGPQVRFELTPAGADRLHGVGHGIGPDPLFAIRFELVRKR